MLFSGLGPLALCPVPFASQSTSRIPSGDWVAMTMSTMGWGVKSPASQALVHPPHSPRHLKGEPTQVPGLRALGHASSPPLSSPPTRKHQVVDKVMTGGVGRAAQSHEVWGLRCASVSAGPSGSDTLRRQVLGRASQGAGGHVPLHRLAWALGVPRGTLILRRGKTGPRKGRACPALPTGPGHLMLEGSRAKAGCRW